MAIHYIYSGGESPKWYKKQKSVYKFLPLFDAFHCLDTSSFWFSNPERWKDPYEKLFLTASYQKQKESKEFPYGVLCFCARSDPNCEAAWRMYGNDTVRFCVHLETFMNRIGQSIGDRDVYVGKVMYKKRKDIKELTLNDLKGLFCCEGIPLDPYIASMFIKRESFRYEHEMRILIKYPKTANMVNGEEISFKDYKSVIKNVLLAPDTDRPDQKKNFFHKHYGFSVNKKDANVKKSSLYGSPARLTVKE